MCVGQAFGWCPNGTRCPLSHDTDLIILQDEKGTRDKRKKRKRQREKGGGDQAAEGSSIFDGAPENKVPHMEVEETPDHQQRPESCLESGPLRDSDRNTQQNEGENMKTDNENRTCEDNTGFRKSATTSTSDHDTKTSTDDGRESRTEDGKIIDQPSKTADQKKKADTGTHRAGFDAFMTGYIFAYSCTHIKKDEVGGVENKEHQEEELSWLPTCLNKVYLSRKAAPLNVVKSTFSKSSKAHVQKMEMVWGERL